MSKDSLAPTNLLKGPMTSNFEQWQQNRKSANCVMKINNDASDNCLLYSYLSHDSLIQVVLGITFNLARILKIW